MNFPRVATAAWKNQAEYLEVIDNSLIVAMFKSMRDRLHGIYAITNQLYFPLIENYDGVSKASSYESDM